MGHSYHYDYDQFEELFIHQKNSFNVISSNIESVNSKFDEIKLYIDMLREKQLNISAICLQECWISNENDISLLQINGYKCLYQKRSCSSKGGLIIYVNKNFNHTEKYSVDNSEN